MAQPTDAPDLRRAPEDQLLQALRDGHPLALAEAYHRTVPAGHAVARRLVSGAEDVERLLLAVYERLWADPPAVGPLEGWVRRTTWAMGVDRLRAEGRAPASPSAAGLVPDLPAPDVRFLDAAERAIAELPDEQRRALLLAHDKGVPVTGQEDGAAEALVAALLALAGPETAGGDRDALEQDPCADVPAMGDWCLGLAGGREHADVEGAIETRPGCAATSRAVRRGRRRIEGLPATPDMGQRVLVTVLTAAGAVRAPAAAELDGEPEAAAVVPAVPAAPVDGPAEDAEGDAAVGIAADPEVAAAVVPPADDPFAAPDDPFAAPDGPFAEPPDADTVAAEPFGEADAPADTAELPAAADTGDLAAVAETGDLPTAADDADGVDGATADEGLAADGGAERAEADLPPVDWRPDPGSTAELRLSDILAEGDDEDDPFAGLDDEPAVARPGDPYAALRDLDGDPAGPAVGPPTGPLAGPAPVEDDDEHLVGGYEEGQEDLVDAGASRGGRGAAVLSWVLPALGGTVIGLIAAILYFGLP